MTQQKWYGTKKEACSYSSTCLEEIKDSINDLTSQLQKLGKEQKYETQSNHKAVDNKNQGETGTNEQNKKHKPNELIL